MRSIESKYTLAKKAKQYCRNGHDTFIVGRNVSRCCRICAKSRAVQWNQQNPARRKEITHKYQVTHKADVFSRKFKTPLTSEQLTKLQQRQNNLCAICRRSALFFNRGLSVDHDHITLKVRGLLCPPCNVGLGMFGDSTIRLKEALEYLNRCQ